MRFGRSRLDTVDPSEPALGFGGFVLIERHPGEGQVGGRYLHGPRPTRFDRPLDHGPLGVGLRIREIASLSLKQSQVRCCVEVRAEHSTPAGCLGRGREVLLGLDVVPEPQLGGTGVAESQERDHVPGRQSEAGERTWIVRDPAGGRGDRRQPSLEPGVAHLYEVEQQAKALRSSAGEAVRPVGRGGHQLTDFCAGALHDAGARQGARELGMAQEHVSGHRRQKHVELTGAAAQDQRREVHAREVRGE